jgi:hypothetical protein
MGVHFMDGMGSSVWTPMYLHLLLVTLHDPGISYSDWS